MAMLKQICSVTGKLFEISEEELAFLKTVSPTFGGKKFLIPPPTVCPEERLRHRLAFRNLRNLYRRKCDSSGNSILSMFEPIEGAPPVYHREEFWSDKWDSLAYGRDFDFSRPFFEQFQELYSVVPRIHNYVILSENCEYINGAANCKNCFLSFNMDYCEDCYYLNSGIHCRSCINCMALKNCELCYECTDSEDCYNLLYSDLCLGCSDSYFLTSCRRCRNCIACTNLVDKEYCIFNEQKTKAEFLEIVASLRSHTAVEELRIKASEFSLNFPRKNYFGNKNDEFSGNNITHVKNSYECFDGSELENCRYCFYTFKASNCMDFSIFGDGSEWIYQCLATGLNCSFDLFCAGCWGGSSYNMYCMTVHASSHCFGCVSIRRKEYCILNKQYTKAEYDALMPKIAAHMIETGEWGQFFPKSLSPFDFNVTVANDEYTLKKEEALKRGYRWKDRIEEKPSNTKTNFIDHIDDVEDKITTEILNCSETSIPFKVIPQELALYRQLGIPVPQVTPNVRYRRLLERRTPRQLWDRNCKLCNAEMRTVYSPERSEQVICETCFQREVLA
jgi:hypothetical protein